MLSHCRHHKFFRQFNGFVFCQILHYGRSDKMSIRQIFKRSLMFLHGTIVLKRTRRPQHFVVSLIMNCLFLKEHSLMPTKSSGPVAVVVKRFFKFYSRGVTSMLLSLLFLLLSGLDFLLFFLPSPIDPKPFR